MPELPEVETIRRQLDGAIVGKTITRVEVLEPKMFIGDQAKIIGQKITGTGRRAKVLRIFFENGAALLAHFKLNGQFFWEKPGQKMPDRFTRIILYLDDGSRLLFNDSRKFAWLKVMENYAEEPVEAIEPFTPDFTLQNFKKVIGGSRKPIKLLLMDQDKIGGIGNIYANESLFKARINPFRAANSLSDAEAEELFKAIPEILKKAIECKGSSGKDEWYRQIDNSPGCYQENFLVYQRDGQSCSGFCNDTIRRVKQNGRSTFYCPICQK